MTPVQEFHNDLELLPAPKESCYEMAFAEEQRSDMFASSCGTEMSRIGS